MGAAVNAGFADVEKIDIAEYAGSHFAATGYILEIDHLSAGHFKRLIAMASGYHTKAAATVVNVSWIIDGGRRAFEGRFSMAVRQDFAPILIEIHNATVGRCRGCLTEIKLSEANTFPQDLLDQRMGTRRLHMAIQYRVLHQDLAMAEHLSSNVPFFGNFEMGHQPSRKIGADPKTKSVLAQMCR